MANLTRRILEGITMATVRAKYENGVLTPLEPLELEEGKEVLVSVQDGDIAMTGKDRESYEAKLERFLSAAGSWKDTVSEDFIDMIYESRITGSRWYPRD